MKCSQKTCDLEATYSYVWPGDAKRSYACDKHVDVATRIGSAMGFTLGDVRYEGPEPETAPTSRSGVGGSSKPSE